jgi:hypothetical protein
LVVPAGAVWHECPYRAEGQDREASGQRALLRGGEYEWKENRQQIAIDEVNEKEGLKKIQTRKKSKLRPFLIIDQAPFTGSDRLSGKAFLFCATSTDQEDSFYFSVGRLQ